MRRTPRTLGLMTVTALLAVPACSSGDDDSASSTVAEDLSEEPAAEPAPADEPAEEPADEPAEEPAEEPTEEPADEPAEEPADEGDTIFIESVSDLPDECVDRVVDMLHDIEPIVSEVDWETATLDDLDTIMIEIEDEFEALDEDEETSGCARYEFEDDTASFDAMLELAEEEAPGAVGWLTFVQDVFTALPGSGEETAVEGAPADCEEAIAYLEEVVADGGTMSALPLAELTAVSQAFNVVTTDCDVSTMSEFLERPDVSAFLS